MRVPINVSVKLEQTSSVLLAYGPLGRAAIQLCPETTFFLEGGQLRWVGRAPHSKRNEQLQRSRNKSLRRILSNIFDKLSAPEIGSFQLLGRGYRVS